MISSSEVERIWKEAVVTFEVLSRYLPERDEENEGKSLSRLAVPWTRF
jgi:hypothetical protein